MLGGEEEGEGERGDGGIVVLCVVLCDIRCTPRDWSSRVRI